MPAANHQSHGFIRTCCSKGNAQVFATPEHHEVRTDQPARQDHYGKHYSAVWTCSTKRITRLRKQKSPATATAVSALLPDLPLSSFNITRLCVQGHMFLRAKHGRRKHIRGDSSYEPWYPVVHIAMTLRHIVFTETYLPVAEFKTEKHFLELTDALRLSEIYANGNRMRKPKDSPTTGNGRPKPRWITSDQQAEVRCCLAHYSGGLKGPLWTCPVLILPAADTRMPRSRTPGQRKIYTYSSSSLPAILALSTAICTRGSIYSP
jgi:hypothetical protein